MSKLILQDNNKQTVQLIQRSPRKFVVQVSVPSHSTTMDDGRVIDFVTVIKSATARKLSEAERIFKMWTDNKN